MINKLLQAEQQAHKQTTDKLKSLKILLDVLLEALAKHPDLAHIEPFIESENYSYAIQAVQKVMNESSSKALITIPAELSDDLAKVGIFALDKNDDNNKSIDETYIIIPQTRDD